MHEFGIAQQMVATALDYAQAHHAQRIISFHIEMRDLADESEESLRLYLESLTQGTPAENARFDIERVRVTARCNECGTEFAPESLGEPCPQCGSARLVVTPTDEFALTRIQIE